MNIGIYSRKSKITETGDSIKNQIQLCKEYAYKYFEIGNVYIYEDEGFSGRNTKRPEFQKMLKDAKNSKLDIIICYRLDRISRNVLDFSNTLHILTLNEIEFVSIRDNFDTSTPMGRAMMYIASVFAQLERETIAERIKDNMYKLAETGRWLGGITPLGYKSTKIIDKSTGKYISVLIDDPYESKTVKLIFDKYLECRSLSRLQIYTLELNLKTRNDKDFSLSSLKKILSNPVYMSADKNAYEYFSKNNCTINIHQDTMNFNGNYGIMAYNKNNETNNKINQKAMSQWIISIGVHHPIILSAKWIHVQKILQLNKHRTYSTPSKRKALLTPIIKCKSCNKPLRVISKYENNKVKYFYYKCRVKELTHSKECSIRNLNGNASEKLILDAIEHYISIDKLIEELESYAQSVNSSNANNKISNLQKEITQTKNAIYHLTLILSSKTNAVSKYIIKEIDKLDTKLHSLNKQLDILTNSTATKANDSYNMDFLLNNEIHSMLSHEQKKLLINKTIKNIYWDGNNLELELLHHK
ncbi:serine recombinase [Vallitalea longa]|uniref:Serine recombinase n=1 Tax=Vallitalea longa TaxID=2936439 RepID=A0A9W5YAP6_9FIRM|nr:recombinase family protein [Vallitalea longa]GKX27823.1 serine recombinase [Vallitalea longa]